MNDQSNDVPNDQPNDQPKTMIVTNVESPLDRRRVGDMKIEKFGGLSFAEYREAVEFAKLMCQGKHSIPKYLKNNSIDCLAIITQSLKWNLEPFFVAQHSYVAKKDDPDSPIAYDSSVFSAIMTASAVLKGRPRYTYAGEGEERTCTIVATFVGETDPHDYTTPPLKQCRPRRNEQGFTKGSPLWDKDPDQQLGYYAVRNFARRHCAEVLGGIYDRDEFEDAAQHDDPSIVPASPNLLARLAGKMTAGQGFHPDNVETVRQAPTEPAGEGSRKTAPEAPRPDPAAQTATAQAAKPKQTRKPKPEPAAPPPAAAQQPADHPPPAEAPPPPPVAPPQAEAAPSPPAEPAVIEPPKPAAPRNAEEYLAYLKVWLGKTTDDARIYDRWTEEKDLRGNCGVVGQHFDQAKEVKDARLAELEG